MLMLNGAAVVCNHLTCSPVCSVRPPSPSSNALLLADLNHPPPACFCSSCARLQSRLQRGRGRRDWRGPTERQRRRRAEEVPAVDFEPTRAGKEGKGCESGDQRGKGLLPRRGGSARSCLSSAGVDL
ncbi:hypothetical protein U9M48_035069 [Paspalum notatum var. saurae]|uniref:Uncharacterized protein n=1 Tax=Paspalum notatum var. saurae TaxID=547442 RepID=A0AAQ3UBS4_PASNO